MGIFDNEREEQQLELEQQLAQAELAIWILKDKNCLNLLSPEQQISTIDNIIDKSIYQKVCTYAEDRTIKYITFKNANVIAKELVLAKPDVAKALFEELKCFFGYE